MLGIPVTEVENQTQLWEILSGMKLANLEVELCVLLPSDKDQERSKCIRLQAFKSHCIDDCDTCLSKVVDKNISVLSY